MAESVTYEPQIGWDYGEHPGDCHQGVEDGAWTVSCKAHREGGEHCPPKHELILPAFGVTSEEAQRGAAAVAGIVAGFGVSAGKGRR